MVGFKVLLADSDCSFLSLLGRALLDVGYRLCPAESKEIAFNQLETQCPKAAILDVDLPGGIGELMEACLERAIPIVVMGAAPRKETKCLVEIMYHGIPYVKKFENDGQARVGKVVARLNALLTTLLIFRGTKEYEQGVLAGLSTLGYKVFVADRASNLTQTFLTSEPRVVLAYYPRREDLEELAKIRAMDARVHITVVLDHEEDNLTERALEAGATAIIPKCEFANYLLKFQTVGPSQTDPNWPHRPRNTGGL